MRQNLELFDMSFYFNKKKSDFSQFEFEMTKKKGSTTVGNHRIHTPLTQRISLIRNIRSSLSVQWNESMRKKQKKINPTYLFRLIATSVPTDAVAAMVCRG